MLSHLVTLRCQCGCDFCLWKGDSEELDTQELLNIYSDAKAFSDHVAPFLAIRLTL